MVEVTLEFTDTAPALPLMFLIAPKGMMQAEFLVCRG